MVQINHSQYNTWKQRCREKSITKCIEKRTQKSYLLKSHAQQQLWYHRFPITLLQCHKLLLYLYTSVYCAVELKQIFYPRSFYGQRTKGIASRFDQPHRLTCRYVAFLLHFVAAIGISLFFFFWYFFHLILLLELLPSSHSSFTTIISCSTLYCYATNFSYTKRNTYACKENA